MANKLPWFTHDHDAHEDHFIQESMDKFGHFGYSSYFIILELMHKHGVGDSLSISRSRLCQKLRSRWPQVRLYLDFSRTSDKVQFTLSGDEVQLQIKKFRERQSKLKIKIPSTYRQSSLKTPIEREGERDGEKDLRATPEASEKAKTKIQDLVEAYKVRKGFALDDKAWDKGNFGRCSKAAKTILSVFGDDLPQSLGYLESRSSYLESKGLDWSLETIAKHASDAMGTRVPSDAEQSKVNEAFKKYQEQQESDPWLKAQEATQ